MLHRRVFSVFVESEVTLLSQTRPSSATSPSWPTSSVSRDVSVEGLDAHLRDFTGDRLDGVDRSRLLALGASREAELRRLDAADAA